MKEVKKCSISGIAFTLDADAYALLSRYLDSLKATYAETADGDEIVADIEARIAELILSQQENSRVVETPLLRQERPRTSRPKAKPTQPKSSRASRAVSPAPPRTPAWAGCAPGWGVTSTSTPHGCA